MKILRNIAVFVLLLFLAAGVALWFTVRSAWFAEQIRAKIVEGLQQATGGKAELDSFSFDPATWQVGVKGLTVHGTEPAGQTPLVYLKSAAIGWKLISLAEKRIDVLSIDVDSPVVSLKRDAKGDWNLPRLAKPSPVSPFEQFVNLKAGRVRVTNGTLYFDERVIPLAFEARDAEVVLAAADGPSYTGSAKSSRVHLTRPFLSPIDASLTASVRLDAQGLSFSDTQIGFGKSIIRAQGRMTSWIDPVLDATAEGDFRVSDIRKPLALPLEPTGQARVKSTWKLADKYVAGKGTLTASGLDWTISGVRISPLDGNADWSVSRTGITMDRLQANLLGGTFKGKARVDDWSDFSIEGDVADLALSRLYSLHENREFPWSGAASGSVRAEGSFPKFNSASGQITVQRAEGATPIDGGLTFEYNAAGDKLLFGPSHFELARSRADFSGDPNAQLKIKAASSDLNEIFPAIQFFYGRTIKSPVTLDDGAARLEGTVTNGSAFTGTLETGRFTVHDARLNASFDRFRTSLEASASGLRLDNFRLDQGITLATGSLRLSLHDSQLTAQDTITGNLQLASVDVARALHESGLDAELPSEAKLTGTLNTTLRVSGTVETPAAAGELRLANASVYGEPIDRARFTLQASRTQLLVESGEISSGSATGQADGVYTPSKPDWQSGRARFNVTANLGALRRWLPSMPDGFEADARANAKGEIAFNAGAPTLISLEGAASIPQLTLNGRPLGDAAIQATSTGSAVNATLNSRLLGSQVRGTAEWSITGNNQGLGQAQVIGLTLENLRTLGLFGDPNRPLPARGSLDAEFTFRGPIFRPDQWTAQTRVTRLAIEPRPVDATIDTARFSLRNSGPLTGTFDSRGFTFESARLVGEGTDLKITGSVGIRSRAPWNLALKGSFNLNGLSVLEPDLEASGVSMLDATVRGELYRPAINGSMQVDGASFRFRDAPNGLDQLTGIIRFDTNRATIEKLTAQTGGGTLALSGFVGFGGPQLVYRLQGQAQRVRVRYPEEVSTTFNGRLSLSGTSSQSLLSGDISVVRLALQAQGDIGALLTATARSSLSTPTQNAFLRGMQLDVHIVTAPDAELQTSLSRDIQPQADLSLRGTAARPVALGRATVSEGEINFVGNRYRVNRGEVNFYNATRTEPILNFDLETTVRGIVVNITLSGPLDKLNTSYRSDPPLQPNEIITLIAVGRDTTAPNSQTASPTTTSALQQSSGGGSLLGGAVSSAVASPVSGRLQRLFGISRINIDPDLNSTSPQARLNVEEQVSRDVRINFITNLSKTQSQIWRFQYDFSKDFSLIGIRDENGLFGLDFQFRKRFK